MSARSLPLRLSALVAAVALGVTGAVVAVGGASADDHAGGHVTAKQTKDPRKRLGLFVDPLMPAANEERVYQEQIGSKAQAFWVIPEAYPTRKDPDRPWLVPVKQAVGAYARRADDARKTPMLVVYGIPGRDCGSHSSEGSLENAAQYRAWINRLAEGLRGADGLVVLEPDALPLFSSDQNPCPTERAGWEDMLRYAAKTLSRTGAWVYIDAGHSNWSTCGSQCYGDRPAVLKRAGMKFARGISTNVSNFRPTADEHAYAKKMLSGLRQLGVKGKRYIIDTSRNGNPDPSPDGWDVLNPTWAQIGKPPRLVFQGAFDGTLWVKHPGESDGRVNGGNASGAWCDMLADRLLPGDQPDQGYCPE